MSWSKRPVSLILILAGLIFALSIPFALAEPAAFIVSDEELAEAYLILVNADHPLTEEYEPDDLVLMDEYCDPGILTLKASQVYGQRKAVDALMDMLSAAIEDGLKKWQVNSAYRSYAGQQAVWDNRVYGYRQEGLSGSEARSAAARYVALAGQSEHQTGLAFDLSIKGENSFPSTQQCKWLSEHCWEYGFIIRYTAEKKPLTGINAEPWHIRYVGLPYSLEMRDANLCLEEFTELREAP